MVKHTRQRWNNFWVAFDRFGRHGRPLCGLDRFCGVLTGVASTEKCWDQWLWLVYFGVLGRCNGHYAAKFQFDIATIHWTHDWFHPHFLDLRASTMRCQEITMGTMRCQEITMGLVLGRGFCGLYEQFDEVLCDVKKLLWELCDVKKLLWDVKKLFICDDSIQGWGSSRWV